MNNDVILEPTFEEFPKKMPDEINISILRTFCAGQVVTITAKVAHLYAPKEVKKGSQTLHLQECMIVDPSGRLKLVLWEEHVVLQGNTYEFCNIRVNNKYENEVFVNTVKSCTSIKECTPFTQILHVAVETCNTRVKGEILGVFKVSDY